MQGQWVGFGAFWQSGIAVGMVGVLSLLDVIDGRIQKKKYLHSFPFGSGENGLWNITYIYAGIYTGTYIQGEENADSCLFDGKFYKRLFAPLSWA